MMILFQPSQDEMSVTQSNGIINIRLNNQTGDAYTVALDIETANFLIRNLLEHVWLLSHAPKLNALRQELIPF